MLGQVLLFIALPIVGLWLEDGSQQGRIDVPAGEYRDERGGRAGSDAKLGRVAAERRGHRDGAARLGDQPGLPRETADGTEHLLLGLMREGEGIAARVLRGLNVDIERTRNEILMELDPEVLDHVSKAMSRATKEHKQEQKPPSLFQLAKRATSEDSRRGLSFMTLILSGLGKSLKD